MSKQIVEVEANSLKEAREKVKSQIPKGLHLLSEEIISDGKSKRVKGVADTIEAALEKAQKKIPADADVVEKKTRISPAQRMVTVKAFSEQHASAQVQGEIDNTAILRSLILRIPGKKGLLGIGKKPNIYEAQVFQRAVVEVIYKRKAKISATIGKWMVPSKGYCQMCGKSNCSPKVSKKSANFFCSSNCEESYFKASIGSILFGPNTFVIAGEGVDTRELPEMRMQAQALKAYCWFCGKRMPMSEDKCCSCGKDQEIRI